jgi:hypothetical protein
VVWKWQEELLLVAAADHCLEPAYRGRCPSVDIFKLREWRAESRAAFQKRPVEAVKADINNATALLRSAVLKNRIDKLQEISDRNGWIAWNAKPLKISENCFVAGSWRIVRDELNVRRLTQYSVVSESEEAEVLACPIKEYADLRGMDIPELPEAAVIEGIPFLADQTDRDGRKKVVLMAAPAELVKRFLAGELVPGLIDLYGDPARGFAGGYLK